MMPRIFSLLISLLSLSTVFCSQQAVTVKGIVNCRGHRQPGTFVQLFDEDSIFDSDDLLGSVVADHRGVFCVKGNTEEFTTIEPYILIEHNCGYEGLNEKRVFTRVVPVEYITEGPKAKNVYHMGDIELLTADAPVQKYEKRIYVETNMDERIRQCIPIYVQYKRFYEKTVFESNVHETVLPTDEDPVVIEEPVVVEPTDEGDEVVAVTEETIEPVDEHVVDHDVAEEEKKIEEERLRLKEEQRRLDEIRRLEEESLRLEEIRRIEEEKKRIEKIRRQEEEQQRIELERREEERRLENERRAEEERKREEEAKLQEQRRKEQEEEHKRRMDEYHRREQERQDALKRREEEIKRREEEEKVRISSSSEKFEKKDPCVHYPVLTQSQSISRSIEARHEYVEDPCLKR